MRICAIYARVSDESQVEGDSIRHQVGFAKAFARRRGVEQGESWVTPEEWVFIDEGISGTSMVKRTAVRRLIECARKGHFDIVLFKGISRFARDTVDALVMLRTLLACRVRVISLEENFDSARDNAEFVFTIHSALAQAESEKTAIRVRMGAMEKAKSGQWNGRPPDGYRLNRITKHLEIDEIYAPIVKEIFNLYQNGYGCRKIATLLNERQLYTRQGNLWTQRNISRILRNPAYVGDVVYGRRTKRMAVPDEYTQTGSRRVTVMSADDDDVVVHRDAHPPIVDRATFDAVHSRLANRNQNPGRDGNVRLLSRGLLRCSCGGPMTVKYSGKKVAYYRCGRQAESGRSVCDAPYVRCDRVEEVILSQIRSDIERTLDFTKTVIRTRQHHHAYFDRIQAEREQQFHRTSRLFEKYSEGQLGESQFEHLNRFIRGRLEFLDSMEKRLNMQVGRASPMSSDVLFDQIRHTVLQHLSDVTTNPALTRELIHVLVENIEIVFANRNRVGLRIHYQFSSN